MSTSITLNKAKGTYCFDYDLDFSGVEGLRAYVASGFNPETGTLLLMHVDEVPANTGLLLKGTAGTTYEVPVKETAFYYMNMFKGTLERQTVASIEDGYSNYILKDGVFCKSDGTATVGANKAYLQLPTSAARARQVIYYQTDDETTNIDAIDEVTDEADCVFYNMSGQRVSTPLRGIYIKNGKKIIIH